MYVQSYSHLKVVSVCINALHWASQAEGSSLNSLFAPPSPLQWDVNRVYLK